MRGTTLSIVIVGVALVSVGCHRRAGDKDAKTPRHHNTQVEVTSAPQTVSVPAPAAWAPAAPGTPSVDRMTGTCTLPVHKDDYAGFSIGYPAGWSVDYSTGTITVTKDAKSTVGAIVFPARVRRDIPAEQFAESFASALGSSITQHGGTFELRDRVTNGHVAHARAFATIDGVKLTGPLQVVSERGFVTVKLYWAPEARFAKEEPTLKQVVSCFHRQMMVTAKAPKEPPGGQVTRVGAAAQNAASAPTARLKPFQSRYFIGSMPEGWVVKDETANGIDLVSADQTMAVGFGWVSNPVTAPTADVQRFIAQYYPGSRILVQGPISAPNGWQAFAAEFESSNAHGYSQSSRSNSVSLSTSLLASPARWDAAKPTLAAIARSIQITQNGVNTVNAQVRAHLATLPRAIPSSSAPSSAMASWEARQAVQDRSARNFDDAIRGQDRAISPSTGEEYVVPQSAWNPSGPQGAGYYRAVPGGSAELLTTPSP